MKKLARNKKKGGENELINKSHVMNIRIVENLKLTFSKKQPILFMQCSWRKSMEAYLYYTPNISIIIHIFHF